MQYSYRGVDYHCVSPTLEVTETEVFGHYRGTPCRRRQYETTHLHQPTDAKKYRGIEYGQKVSVSHTYPEPHTYPEQNSAQTPTIPDVVPQSIAVGASIKYARPTGQLGVRGISELDKIHNTFIRQTLEHRLAVAKRKGDQGLIQMLEQEQHQLH